ncbi:hypothetical protein [Frankia nepalensis]|uniref:hypothetical protein n=1 Tax=Frankia nepalensis TaxID=1836974 RepID=UPI0019344461|nr:hypothetical protein [Frankia nepalensis]MBL7495602.1 hypothetical protein [Frankia nepalensis]MBL7508848.1 hypothetical protein [Frankia nepalensis]
MGVEAASDKTDSPPAGHGIVDATVVVDGFGAPRSAVLMWRSWEAGRSAGRVGDAEVVSTNGW